MEVYLDKAATCGKIPSEVIEEIQPYLTEMCGNASSLYSIGRKSNNAIKTATDRIKAATGAKEVYYTSGATESNNWIINNFRNGRILASAIEHPSILNTLRFYKNEYKTDYKLIEVCTDGSINYTELCENLQKGADLCTIMCVNNEIGTIQDINKIYTLCHEYGCALHTDLTQAYSHIDITKLKYDYASLSSHKFGGLQGTGVLLCNAPINPFIIGGHQQGGYRGGTYNLCGIVSMGKAIELNNYTNRVEEESRCREIQTYFYNAFAEMEDVHFNTDLHNSVPTTLNIAFKNVESESLMLLLDIDGISVSSGSACNSGSLDPSYVLKAIHCPDEYIYGSIRLSWDSTLTNEQIEYAIDRIKTNVRKIRGY